MRFFSLKPWNAPQSHLLNNLNGMCTWTLCCNVKKKSLLNQASCESNRLHPTIKSRRRQCAGKQLIRKIEWIKCHWMETLSKQCPCKTKNVNATTKIELLSNQQFPRFGAALYRIVSCSCSCREQWQCIVFCVLGTKRIDRKQHERRHCVCRHSEN